MLRLTRFYHDLHFNLFAKNVIKTLLLVEKNKKRMIFEPRFEVIVCFSKKRGVL